MDLKREFDKTIANYGHPIFLVRSDQTMRCRCYDSLTGSTKRDCPYCFGTGYVSRVEKHRVVDASLMPKQTMANAGVTAIFGDAMQGIRIFYMKSEVRPMPDDIIIETEFDEQGRPIVPTRSPLVGVYTVGSVEPQRLEGGRIIFYKMAGTYDPTAMKDRALNVNNYINYDIQG